MALVFDNIKAEPQTHAFIIGVGGYPFLSGGAQEKAQIANQIGILKQLTSPPKSALAFRDGLLNLENKPDIHFDKPLGSIELLVSPSPDDPDPGNVGEVYQPATINNIMNAYNDWKVRCDTHAGNIAIFFFSGHGVEKMQHFLLAEDFGDNPNNPWLGSFNFDETRRAFHGCKAITQCFFVDSCRQITAAMLQSNLMTVPALEIPNFNIPDCHHDLVMKAAAHNVTAHGQKKKPSYFTQAVLKAFEGYIADKKGTDTKWMIRTKDIANNIYDLLDIVKPGQGFKQRCTNHFIAPGKFIHMDSAPMARLSVSCEPEAAIPAAELSCKDLMNSNTQTRAIAESTPWELDVKAGIYELSASFPNQDFTDCRIPEKVTPLDNLKILNC